MRQRLQLIENLVVSSKDPSSDTARRYPSQPQTDLCDAWFLFMGSSEPPHAPASKNNT